jgi:hypothetical protein
MNWLTFISEIIKALAWPVAAVAMLLLLRRSLLILIPRLMKIRYKEFEADFSETLRRVELRAENAQLPSANQVGEIILGHPEHAPDKYLRMAQISPRAAILEASRDLDFVVRHASTGEDFNDIQTEEHPDLHFTISRLVRDQKLDRASADLYEELSNLRNRALHAYDHEVTPDAAYDFGLLSSRLAAKIKAITDRRGGTEESG